MGRGFAVVDRSTMTFMADGGAKRLDALRRATVSRAVYPSACVVVGLFVIAAPCHARAEGPEAQAALRAGGVDPWLGRDKALHFGASAVLAASAYALTAITEEDLGVRLAVGATISLALGAGKELRDLWGPGHASWKDMTWNVLGTAAGLLLAWAVDRTLGAFFGSEAPAGRATVGADERWLPSR